jgi:hypothetical protein
MLRELYQKAQEAHAEHQKHPQSIPRVTFVLPGMNLLEQLYSHAVSETTPTVGKTLEVLNLFNPYFNPKAVYRQYHEIDPSPQAKIYACRGSLAGDWLRAIWNIQLGENTNDIAPFQDHQTTYEQIQEQNV